MKQRYVRNMGPTIIFVESQRWGAIALVCALLLAAETVLLWHKGRAAARPRPWRVFGLVVFVAALGVLGASAALLRPNRRMVRCRGGGAPRGRGASTPSV